MERHVPTQEGIFSTHKRRSVRPRNLHVTTPTLRQYRQRRITRRLSVSRTLQFSGFEILFILESVWHITRSGGGGFFCLQHRRPMHSPSSSSKPSIPLPPPPPPPPPAKGGGDPATLQGSLVPRRCIRLRSWWRRRGRRGDGSRHTARKRGRRG